MTANPEYSADDARRVLNAARAVRAVWDDGGCTSDLSPHLDHLCKVLAMLGDARALTDEIDYPAARRILSAVGSGRLLDLLPIAPGSVRVSLLARLEALADRQAPLIVGAGVHPITWTEIDADEARRILKGILDRYSGDDVFERLKALDP